MTVFESIYLMLLFSMLVLALLTYIDRYNKRK